jgi:NNP family nitrate/nitrite transporter-like MFS transporter
MATARLNLFSFSGKTRILHLTWFAFFLTFLVWFNHAPLLVAIKDSMARLIYSFLLFVSSFLCFFFAIADTFEMLALARFLMGFVGAGFVIGIRIVSEWYPAKQVGLAEGVYKGLGNVGSAAAAVSLPALALVFGGDDGWRYATGLTGVLTLVYSFVYYHSVTDTPAGSTYFKPNKTGGLEVTSKKDFIYYLLLNIPMYAALALLTWKVSVLGLLDDRAVHTIYAALAGTYILHGIQIYKVNTDIFRKAVPEMHRYKFKQVSILSLAYAVTFGAELAVVSMLPLFFLETFDIPVVTAGLLAACFAGMDIISCPSGGWLSDRFGRKKTLLVLLSVLATGFLLMSQINAEWPVLLAVLLMMACSFFVGSGAGGVFAVVPLIRRRLTGQIAGVVGAYGNIGAVLFLTVLSFVSAQDFFMVIAGAVAITVAAVMFLEEPEGHMVEVLPDGTVQMIEVT